MINIVLMLFGWVTSKPSMVPPGRYILQLLQGVQAVYAIFSSLMSCWPSDSAEKIPLYWAWCCGTWIYNSILNLICICQFDCRLSRWLYGWWDGKRSLKYEFLPDLLAGSSCIHPLTQFGCSSDSFLYVRLVSHIDYASESTSLCMSWVVILLEC
jgi:hypothetical protein